MRFCLSKQCICCPRTVKLLQALTNEKNILYNKGRMRCDLLQVEATLGSDSITMGFGAPAMQEAYSKQYIEFLSWIVPYIDFTS
jgi:heterodisulfide reductase subunit C